MDKEIYEELFLGYTPSHERLVELQREINQLKRCVKSALDYRPLFSDPFQEFVRKVHPEILREWEKERGR